jgi:hypothetical protein
VLVFACWTLDIADATAADASTAETATLNFSGKGSVQLFGFHWINQTKLLIKMFHSHYRCLSILFALPLLFMNQTAPTIEW